MIATPIGRRVLALALVVPFLGAAAAGQDQAPAAKTAPSQSRFRLGGYYEGWTLNDKKLTTFFGHSQRNLGGFEASLYTVFNTDVWFSYRNYSDETKTSVFGHRDRFEMNALSFGLVYRPLVWKILEPFIGAGAEFYSYAETIEGDTDLLPTRGNAAGLHFQAGTYLNITKFLAGKLFVRINRVKESLAVPLPDGTTKLDLGGKEFGVGLVFRFQ